MDDGATAAPTGITSWSTTPSQQSKTYLLLARIGAALMAVPLLALAGSASRLVAARRNRRLAQLRLIGGGVGQVVGLTAAEAGVIGASGALLGGVGYVASLPLAVRIPMAGGGWFATDLWVGAAMLVGILFAIAALVTSSAVISLLPVARRPFATARAAHPGMARAWRLAVVAAAVGLFWSVSDGGLRLLAIPLGLVLLALMVAGPWVIRILGTVLARSARTAPGLLAGRRLIDGPRAGWRGVAGMVLAAFVAAYLAAAVPGDVSESVLGPSDRLRLVVVAAQADTAADEARSRLVAAGLDADVSLDEPPSWAPETDRTIWIAVPGDGATLERARTALAGVAPGRVATTPVDDSRSDLLMIDDVRVGAIAVLVSAFLVAAVSAGVGGISWILDQQGILTLVRLAGAPVNALAAARRREVVAPLALCAGAAAILGAALGMLTSGAIGGIGVDGRWLVLFSSLAAAGVLTVLGADLVGRPLLQRATADLADRE